MEEVGKATRVYSKKAGTKISEKLGINIMKNKRKLLLVAPYFYPHVGGLENYCYNIASGFSKKPNWEVVVVTTTLRSKKIQTEVIRGIKIYRLPFIFRFSNTPINPFWYFDIKKIIEKERPSIINAHAPVPFIADIAAQVAGRIPFILTYHAGTMKKNKFVPDLLINFYEKNLLSFAAQRADKIICSSEFVKRTIMGPFRDKAVVVNPSVNLNVFKPGGRVAKNTILFVGRSRNMYAMKGLSVLMKAVKGLPKIKVKVIGEKENRRGDNIEFLGIKKGKELVREFQQATLVALPALSNVESFGTVLIEAMSCKTPVIGSNTGGIPEVINDGVDGFIVPPGNAKKLREAIERIILDGNMRRKMGGSGRRKVEKNYSLKHQIDLTNEVFISL